MRIGIDCHVLDKTQTGVARYLINLLRYWENDGQAELILYSAKNVKNPLNISSTALYYNFSLPRKARKDKVDILFLPFYMRPFFCQVPTAVAIHDISFAVHPEWNDLYHRFIYNFLGRKAIKKSKMIFACSEYTKKEILKKYRINPDKVYVVPLAADEKFNNIKIEEKIRATKEKYGLKDKYLFYVGTIFNRRHVLEAIKAFEMISKKYPNYQFLVSGRNMTRPFQDIGNGTAKVIDYVNEQDLLPLYQGAELFVYLSEYEGFGLPPLEAMACGTPVLTTRKTSLAEVLGNYPIWVDDPKNVEEIKEKMTKVLNDEHLKTEMINRGLERAKQFSWRKAAEETLKTIIDYAK